MLFRERERLAQFKAGDHPNPISFGNKAGIFKNCSNQSLPSGLLGAF
jgi:hypothetical protein